MKIVLAGAAFRGTFSPQEVCDAFEAATLSVFPSAEIVRFPLADGGSGTIQALCGSQPGYIHSAYVTGPRHKTVRGELLLLNNGGAIVESAQAAGMALLPRGSLNPELTTSFGVGELIHRALDLGCKRITVTLGDSATVDGGSGMASALGYRLLDAAGRELGNTAGSLHRVDRIDTDRVHKRLRKTTFRALFDVENPLLGTQGAAAIYGPQKGARPDQIDPLEAGLSHLATVAERDLGISPELRSSEGAGAGGGLGWGCAAWLGAELRSGADEILRILDLESALEHCDLLLVGEGSYDKQSAMGKATGRVIEAARKKKIPCRIICAMGDGEDVWSSQALDTNQSQAALSLRDIEQLARKAISSLHS